MLKLRYLFDNRDLALMLLGNWDYDKNALDMLDYYRISANAIYPYKQNEKTFFLRFTPFDVKTEQEMIEEIKFIQYLKEKELNVLEPILSKDKNYLIKKYTPWGEYLACAFKKVSGDRLDGFNSDGIEYTDDLLINYGKTLGKLHKYSSQYKKVSKKSCFDLLEEMEYSWKNKFNNRNYRITKEFTEIKELLYKIPKNESNFGIIHGDYELDNVFYDKSSKNIAIIDFGSSLYNWYIMDVETSLENIKEELSDKDFNKIKTLFINGYTEEYQYNEKELEFLPLLKRLNELCGYIELLISIEEVWDNEPLWLVELREKLNKNYIQKYEADIEKRAYCT